MKKRTKCYLYTRVSTSMQVDGYSKDKKQGITIIIRIQ